MSRRSLPMFAAAVLILLVASSCSKDSDGAKTTGSTTTAAQSTSIADDAATTTAVTTTPRSPVEPPGDSPEPNAETLPYVDALVGTFDSSLGVGKDNFECLARIWIDVIGADALGSSGVTPEQLAERGFPLLDITDDQANTMVDAFAPCGIDLGVYVRESFSATQTLTDEQTACIDAALTEGATRAVMIDQLMGRQTGDTEAMKRATDCLAS